MAGWILGSETPKSCVVSIKILSALKRRPGFGWVQEREMAMQMDLLHSFELPFSRQSIIEPGGGRRQGI